MRRDSYTSSSYSRGGAFGLAEKEPTLRQLYRWLMARSVKWWVATALLLYVFALCVFFGLDDGDAAGLDAQRSNGGGGAVIVVKGANGKAPVVINEADRQSLPPEELAAINRLLGITSEPSITKNPVDRTNTKQPELPNKQYTTAPAPASAALPSTEPAQWAAVQVAQQAGRAALPQNVEAAASPPTAIIASAAANEAMNAKQAKGNQDELVAAVISAALAPFTEKDRSEWTVGDHAKELQRLQILRDTAQSEVARLQAILESAKKLYAAQATEYESIMAIRALDIRKAQPRRIRPNLQCLGWKQTGSCGPYGAREPEQDHACNQLLTGGVSGYCEVLDTDTNEHFRVMQLNCSSVRDHVSFSCTNAADFANFGLRSQEILDQARMKRPSSLQGSKGRGNGIVMVVYPKLMTSAYATIRALRSYGCILPIELWVLESEMARNPKKTDIIESIQANYGPVAVKMIKDPTITGFTTKIHAIYNSDFENVLFLDADNVPVRDPTFLFYSKEFAQNSAIFWPDFWHPKKTIFNIHDLSLLWELVDMGPVDMFEQESGQILINRRKSAVAMELLQFYAFHRPNHFDRLILAHGDKDLFRLAWLKSKTDFHMIPYPPGAAGVVREGKFCGMTMVQFGLQGDVLFLHRNAKKLNGRVNQMDEAYWTHLQTFKWQATPSSNDVGSDEQTTDKKQTMMSYEEITKKYIIGIQSSAPLFREFQSCYGAEPDAFQHFNLTTWEHLPFAGIEQQIIKYAHEAALLTKQSRKH